jgi:hypothetical protein
VHVSWGDVPGEGQAQRIDQQVALATFDPFMRVEAADATRLLDRFYGLGVDDGCARVRVPADSPAFGIPQSPVEAGPETRAAKLFEMIVHGLPGRKIAG